MEGNGISTGDLALLRGQNDLAGGGGLIFILAIFFLMFGMGGWNRGGYDSNAATAEQVNQGFTNQQLQQISLSSANNNYETAQLINGQTNALMQQNNTNLINAIQGFNQINLSIQNQTNVLAQMLQGLQAQMDSCCCSIKTQMLQDRYEDERAANVALRSDISNFQQSQYILSQTGRWVGWAGSGSPAATSAGT